MFSVFGKFFVGSVGVVAFVCLLGWLVEWVPWPKVIPLAASAVGKKPPYWVGPALLAVVIGAIVALWKG
jgi:hypothetical protein